MRDGYRVIDMDTHVVPHMETLEKYSEPSFRGRFKELEPYYRTKVGPDGVSYTNMNVAPIPYDRMPGQVFGATDVEAKAGGKTSLEGRIGNRHKVPEQLGVNDLNSEGRIKDMDLEGRDIDFIFPGPFARAVTALDDVTLTEGLYRAYHNYMQEYCSVDPARLKSAIQVTGADVEWSVSEIKRLGNEKWVAATWLHLPHGLPVDHPSLEPIWAAMNDLHLPMHHHTFQTDAPYFPGYRGEENWGSVIAVRTFAHPWGAQRLIAYTILSGILDRYPNVQVGSAESGAGWFPSFLLLLSFNLGHLRSAAPDLKYTPIEYGQMGRVRVCFDQLEGPAMTKAAIDVMGEDCFMYQSDYPHPQAEFPETCKMVIDFPIWKDLGDTALRKMMSGNAESFLRL